MRIYLVKSEVEFNRLAMLKYKEEIKLANQIYSTSSQNKGHKDTACTTLNCSR